MRVLDIDSKMITSTKRSNGNISKEILNLTPVVLMSTKRKVTSTGVIIAIDSL